MGRLCGLVFGGPDVLNVVRASLTKLEPLLTSVKPAPFPISGNTFAPTVVSPRWQRLEALRLTFSA